MQEIIRWHFVKQNFRRDFYFVRKNGPKKPLNNEKKRVAQPVTEISPKTKSWGKNRQDSSRSKIWNIKIMRANL